MNFITKNFAPNELDYTLRRQSLFQGGFPFFLGFMKGVHCTRASETVSVNSLAFH